jgi:hypothetical protein
MLGVTAQITRPVAIRSAKNLDVDTVALCSPPHGVGQVWRPPRIDPPPPAHTGDPNLEAGGEPAVGIPVTQVGEDQQGLPHGRQGQATYGSGRPEAAPHHPHRQRK